MRVIENQTNAIIDSLMSGAKSKYEGFGTNDKPHTYIDTDGDLCVSPGAWELIGKKEGYYLLFPEFTKIKGIEYIVCYYLKISEYTGFPITPAADADHRVYAFAYMRNKKTGYLTQGGYIPRLSTDESFEAFNRWAMYLSEIEGQGEDA